MTVSLLFSHLRYPLSFPPQFVTPVLISQYATSVVYRRMLRQWVRVSWELKHGGLYEKLCADFVSVFNWIFNVHNYWNTSRQRQVYCFNSFIVLSSVQLAFCTMYLQIVYTLACSTSPPFLCVLAVRNIRQILCHPKVAIQNRCKHQGVFVTPVSFSVHTQALPLYDVMEKCTNQL